MIKLMVLVLLAGIPHPSNPFTRISEDTGETAFFKTVEQCYAQFDADVPRFQKAFGSEVELQPSCVDADGNVLPRPPALLAQGKDSAKFSDDVVEIIARIFRTHRFGNVTR